TSRGVLEHHHCIGAKERIRDGQECPGLPEFQMVKWFETRIVPVAEIASVSYHVIANFPETLQHASRWTSAPTIVCRKLTVLPPPGWEVEYPSRGGPGKQRVKNEGKGVGG